MELKAHRGPSISAKSDADKLFNITNNETFEM